MEVSFARDPVANPATLVETKPVINVTSTVVSVPTPLAGVTLDCPTTVAAPAAPVTVPAVTRPSNTLLLGDVLPNFSEMIIPRVNLVQYSGILKESFEPGTLLYNQQTPLHIPAKINEKLKTIERAATPPVNVTFIGFRPTRYVEKVPGGGKGLMVATEQAVREAGGTLDYNEWKLKEASGMKRFEYLADGMVVIERPEIVADDDTVFTFEIDGKKYTLALWAVRGTAYTNLCKKILFPARRIGNLRLGGFPSWNFSLSSREESRFNNKYFIPFAMPKAKSTPAMISFIKEIVEGIPTTATEEQAAEGDA